MLYHRSSTPFKESSVGMKRHSSSDIIKTYSDDDIIYSKYTRRGRLGTKTIISILIAVLVTYILCLHFFNRHHLLFKYADYVRRSIESGESLGDSPVASPHMSVRESEYKIMTGICNTKNRKYMKLDNSKAYFKFDTNDTVPTFEYVNHYAKNNILWNKLGRRFDQRIQECDSVNGKTETRFLHVINPFRSTNRRKIFTQNITMASIDAARAWIKHTTSGRILVDVVTIELDSKIDSSSDPPLRPISFYRSPVTLSRTSEDLLENIYNSTDTSLYDSISRNYARRNTRKLPLLKDILKIAHDISSACSNRYDRIIYTNADIGVMPHFYQVVTEMSRCKNTFFINRVEIPDTFSPLSTTASDSRGNSFLRRTDEGGIDIFNLDLRTAYENTLEYEQAHPGYDCLVARPETVSSIIDMIGDIFIGFPPVGSALAKAAKKIDPGCVAVRNLPATFHIGSRNGDWDDAKQDKKGSDNNSNSNNSNRSNGNDANSLIELYNDVNGYLYRKSKLFMSPSSKMANSRGAKGEKKSILETCGAVTMYKYVIKNRETICYPNNFYPIDLSKNRKVRRLEKKDMI